jgi:tetratricopeptide (TPR) repeat protein/transcriptional regulator with XRE-family HTH domain
MDGDSTAASSFGGALKRHRQRLAWSQEDLAEASTVAARTISDLERGVAQQPRSATVRMLAEALGLSGADLAAFKAAARASREAGLRGDPTPARAAAAAAARTVPRMLPRDIESFTGRQAELDRLVAAASGSGGSGGVVRVFAVEGMGGIGKTALALRAAHLIAGQFRDGQLFIDLQGYTPGVRPVAPEDALRSLLFALGVAREQIPEGLAERAALYRGQLAETRTLVILDNAASLSQVEPLLPATAGCLVLVTSRRALSGLDSQVLALDTLPPDEAAGLFRAAVGPGRLADDDPHVAEIVELCGYLPLAIRVLAARLARRRALTSGDVLAELRVEYRRLGNLADDDRNVAAAFEFSYRHLPSIAQRMFASLGYAPGPDFDPLAAANAVDDTDAAAASASLDALLDHSLLSQPAPGRFRFHDLVRDFARVKSAALDGAGLDRMLDFYLYSAQQADDHLERRVRGRRAVPGYSVHKPRELPDVSTGARAVAWLVVELPNLAAASRVALTVGRPAYTVAMSQALAQHLRASGPFTAALDLHRLALDAATQLGDPALQAATDVEIGLLEFQVGRSGDAVSTLERAVDGFGRAGDPNGRAEALANLGVVQRMRGEHDRATASLEEALDGHRAADDPQGQARALRELGATQLQTGQFELAERSLAQATEFSRLVGDRIGEATCLNFLGGVLMTVKKYEPACAALEAGLALYHDLRVPVGEANCLMYLGKAHLDAGASGEAERVLAEAGEIFARMGDHHGRAGVLAYLGDAQRQAGKNREAGQTLAEALRLFDELADVASEGETTNMYAAVALADGDPVLARQRYARGLRLARQVGSGRDQADALAGIAAAHQAEERDGAARRQYARALAAYESMNCDADADRVRQALAGLG